MQGLLFFRLNNIFVLWNNGILVSHIEFYCPSAELFNFRSTLSFVILSCRLVRMIK